MTAWPNSSLPWLAKFVAYPSGGLAKLVAFVRLGCAGAPRIRWWPCPAERQQEQSLNEKILDLGPTIQSKPDFCPICDGRRIIKRGLRKNYFRRLQIYSCKDC